MAQQKLKEAKVPLEKRIGPEDKNYGPLFEFLNNYARGPVLDLNKNNYVKKVDLNPSSKIIAKKNPPLLSIKTESGRLFAVVDGKAYLV
jgi:hypothetical protein